MNTPVKEAAEPACSYTCMYMYDDSLTQKPPFEVKHSEKAAYFYDIKRIHVHGQTV